MVTKMANEIMAVNESNDTLAISENSADFEIPRGFICTVDITTMDGKFDVLNALNGSTSLSAHEDETLLLKNVVTTQGVRSRTGESCTNTYLILADGTTLFSQSDGVKSSVEAIVAVFTFNGVCDFGDGIPVKLISQELSNGNTIKKLVPVRD